VAGIGTFGTLRGAGQRLRESVGAKIIGLEPMLGKPIQGLRNMSEPNAPELYDESMLDHKMSMIPGQVSLWSSSLIEARSTSVPMSLKVNRQLNRNWNQSLVSTT